MPVDDYDQEDGGDGDDDQDNSSYAYEQEDGMGEYDDVLPLSQTIKRARTHNAPRLDNEDDSLEDLLPVPLLSG